MALLPSAHIAELPSHSSFPLCSRPLSLSLWLPRCRFHRFRFSAASSSSVRLAERGGGDSDARSSSGNPRLPWEDNDEDGRLPSGSTNPPFRSAPWLQQWDPPESSTSQAPAKRKPKEPDVGRGGSIERIVYRLRNLELSCEEVEGVDGDSKETPLSGKERLGELLERTWSRPHTCQMVDRILLPWEREDDRGFVEEEVTKGEKRKRLRAPTLAELTIEDSELRRLRRLGIMLRERITVPKAGVTQAITEKIHDAWRKSEIVRLKFHEDLVHDMKTAHELVESRTGGLVIWRSGSVMVVYRGSNYKRPSRTQLPDVQNNQTLVSNETESLFIPDVSETTTLVENVDHSVTSKPVTSSSFDLNLKHEKNLAEEEVEFNHLLDGLGPRFVDWWGTGILPVDADLLPQNIPGFRTPFRLLPSGMRARLTNSEMTNLRKLAKRLPCHFALGRNRHHHGLADAILKIWEKSLVVKIAVKRGVQNTNNKLMAEELKALIGGTLLLRNKYYIVIYRGKDFIPASVATALAEREELTKEIQDAEEQLRKRTIGEPSVNAPEGDAPVGTLAEFLEAQARWGRQISTEERDAMKEEASRYKTTKLFKRVEHKLSIAQAKKARAEQLLTKIEASMVPVNPCEDQETITDEERSVFRRIGLRMKAYLPLGIRGVFDGVIENMHLHWKHRELVKLISKQKTLAFVESTARLLEYESGGILVAIEPVPKGYALIYYRGKNYQRPISLRPRNLLTKAKALKRAIAIQRHEALSQHIVELEKNIEVMKEELVCANGISENEEIAATGTNTMQSDDESSFQMEDEDASLDSDDEEDVSDFYDSEDEEDEASRD
ncbi:CRM-domain containing factor CFM3, chloroplastic/mitochondrial-like isoform X1 [Zingiber officinale]|uniref:CRM-domain containing factor CFM3, chloroplastic/mitochondrial-like isoform X1 n=1 Tax=Zingiber officinale TaxID=94328 RepID=UPI001C4C52FF|nr:CRM-domain containing factor CFM3, chloroplastic/mitochondrial-like isoform X1 [Zingiber officinale]